jgi:hypothetical protein
MENETVDTETPQLLGSAFTIYRNAQPLLPPYAG